MFIFKGRQDPYLNLAFKKLRLQDPRISIEFVVDQALTYRLFCHGILVASWKNKRPDYNSLQHKIYEILFRQPKQQNKFISSANRTSLLRVRSSQRTLDQFQQRRGRGQHPITSQVFTEQLLSLIQLKQEKQRKRKEELQRLQKDKKKDTTLKLYDIVSIALNKPTDTFSQDSQSSVDIDKKSVRLATLKSFESFFMEEVSFRESDQLDFQRIPRSRYSHFQKQEESKKRSIYQKRQQKDINMQMYPQNDQQVSQNQALLNAKTSALSCQDSLSFSDYYLDLEMALIDPDYLENYTIKLGLRFIRKHLLKSFTGVLDEIPVLKKAIRLVKFFKPQLIHNFILGINFTAGLFKVQLFHAGLKKNFLLDGRVPTRYFRIDSKQLQIWPFLMHKAFIKLMGQKQLMGCSLVECLRSFQGGLIESHAMKGVIISNLQQWLHQGYELYLRKGINFYKLVSVDHYKSSSGYSVFFTVFDGTNHSTFRKNSLIQFEEIVRWYSNKLVYSVQQINLVEGYRLVIQINKGRHASTSPAQVQIFLGTPQKIQVNALQKVSSKSFKSFCKQQGLTPIKMPFRSSQHILITVDFIEQKKKKVEKAKDSITLPNFVRIAVLQDQSCKIECQWVNKMGEGDQHVFMTQTPKNETRPWTQQKGKTQQRRIQPKFRKLQFMIQDC